MYVLDCLIQRVRANTSVKQICGKWQNTLLLQCLEAFAFVKRASYPYFQSDFRVTRAQLCTSENLGNIIMFSQNARMESTHTDLKREKTL